MQRVAVKRRPVLRVPVLRLPVTPDASVTGASTAIHRTAPSLPLRWLVEQGHIPLTGRCLDYGCGHGIDARALAIERFDPQWFPVRPEGKFDCVLCSYVLNVLPPAERKDVLADIRKLLKRGGRALLTVRRDIEEPTEGRGCTQYPVKLRYPVLWEDTKFAIYLMRKGR